MINETVFEVKRFLDAELAKCESIKCLNTNIKALFNGKKGDFHHARIHVIYVGEGLRPKIKLVDIIFFLMI